MVKKMYKVEEVEVYNENLEAPEPVDVILFDDEEIEEKFKDRLNDIFGSFIIGSLSFTASDILEEMDPIAYSEELSNSEEELQETETMYECPYCDMRYADEDEAKYCCQRETIAKYAVDGEEFDSIEEAQERADELNKEEYDV